MWPAHSVQQPMRMPQILSVKDFPSGPQTFQFLRMLLKYKGLRGDSNSCSNCEQEKPSLDPEGFCVAGLRP